MSEINDTDFIKLPKDFKAVHNLNELYEKIKIYEDLKKNLKKYKKKYFNSHIMTKGGVLSYIAEDEQLKYIPNGSKHTSLSLYLDFITRYYKWEEPELIVNTINKEIYLHRGGVKEEKFNSDGTIYTVTFNKTKYSTIGEGIVIDKSQTIYHFDIRRNILIDRELFLWTEIGEFGNYEMVLKKPKNFIP